ncbi:hypothetical protein WN943_010297 [Citrus x changshan-huyou]
MDSIEDENEFLIAWDSMLDEYDAQARLVEDILRLEMDGSVQEKVQESPLTQHIDIVKAKGLKKKESSRGRRRFNSSLEPQLMTQVRHANSHDLLQQINFQAFVSTR